MPTNTDNTYFQDVMFTIPAIIGEYTSEQIKWDFDVKIKTIFFVPSKSGANDWLKVERYNGLGVLIDTPLIKIFNIGANASTGGSFEKVIALPVGWYLLVKYNSVDKPKERRIVIRIEFSKSS